MVSSVVKNAASDTLTAASVLAKVRIPQIQPMQDSLSTSSERMVQQEEDPLLTPEKFQTSDEWYAELQGRNILPYEKAYYFNDSRKILDDLGVDNITDNDINAYLDNNDLQGLDNLIVSKYKDNELGMRMQSYRDVLEDIQIPTAEKMNKIKELKSKEVDIDKEATLNNIMAIRAKLTANVLSKKQLLPGNTQKSKEALYEAAYKTNLLAQAVQKNMKARGERSYLDAFGNLVENSMPGSRWAQNALRSEAMGTRGYIPYKGVLDNAKRGLFTGSSQAEMADYIWNLPIDKFSEAVGYISNSPHFNDNLFEQAELLGALMGTTGKSKGLQNTFDVLGAYGTAKQIKGLLPKKAIIPEVYQALPAPNIIDAEFEIIPESVGGASRAQAATKMLAAPAKLLPAPKGSEKAVVMTGWTNNMPAGKGFVMLNDATGFVMMNNPAPVGNFIAGQGAGFKLVNTLQGAVQAYAAGEPIVGDMLVGARESATEAMRSKVLANIDPTPAELFTFMPDISTGTSKATVGNSKVFVEQPKMEPLMDVQQLQDIGPFMTIEDLDPDAFSLLESQASLKQANSRVTLNSAALDIKSDMSITTPSQGGLVLKEVYGVGANGEAPLKASTVKALIKDKEALEGFKLLTDANGDTWLTRESILPYNVDVATPLVWTDYKPFVDNLESLVYSVGGVLPHNMSEPVIQAVGYQSGLRGMFSRGFKNSMKGLNKTQKALMNNIIQEEHLANKYYPDTELLQIVNGDTKLFHALKDARTLNDTAASALNALIIGENQAKGNGWVRPNVSLAKSGLGSLAVELANGTHTGRVLDKVPGNINQNFVALINSEGKGSIFKPGAEIPFDKSNDMIIMLDPPVKLKHDVVTHIIQPKTSNMVKVDALPDRMIGENTWAGLGYKDKYMIRAPREAWDSAGRPDPYSTTVFTASSPAQAKEIIKKFSVIGQVIDDVDNGRMLKETADGIIEATALSGKKPLTQAFTSYDGVKSWMEGYGATTKDLMNLHFDITSTTPLTSLQMGGQDIVNAGNQATRFTRTKDLINPTWDAVRPRYVGMTDYIANTINAVSTRMGLVPTYNTLATRLMKTFDRLIDKNHPPANPIAFMRDPLAYIQNGLIQGGDPAVGQVKLATNMINMAMDQIKDTKTGVEAWLKMRKNELMNDLVHSNLPGFSTLGDALVNGKAGTNLVHSLMYSTYFALRPCQFFIQNFLPAVFGAVTHPIKRAQAMGMSIPLMHTIRALSKGQNVDAIAQSLAQWPALVESGAKVDAGDLIALAQEFRKLGYSELTFSDIRANDVPDRLNNWTMSTFAAANWLSRVPAIEVAALNEMERTDLPFKQFTAKNWAAVARESDAIAGGSSRANKRVGNKIPLVNEAMMFTSYTWNMIESFFGKKMFGTGMVEKAKAAASFGALVTLFGLDTFFSEEQSQKIGMKLSDATGGALDPTTFASGMIGWAAKAMLGYDVHLGSNAPRMFDMVMFKWLTSLVDDDNADLRPAMFSFLSQGYSTMKDIAYAASFDPSYAGEGKDGVDRAIQIGESVARNWSVYSDAEKVYMAARYNEYVNRAGVDRLAKDAPRHELLKKQVVNFFIGVKPLYESGTSEYAMKEYEKDTNAKLTKEKKNIIGIGRSIIKLQDEIEKGKVKPAPDELRRRTEEYANRLELLTFDMSEDQKMKVIKEVQSAVFRGNKEETNKVISRKMNPFTKDNPGFQYYNEQRRQGIVQEMGLGTPDTPKESKSTKTTDYNSSIAVDEDGIARFK